MAILEEDPSTNLPRFFDEGFCLGTLALAEGNNLDLVTLFFAKFEEHLGWVGPL